MENQLTQGSFAPIKDQALALLGDDVAFKKEIGFAIQHVQNNNQLQKAPVESVLKAVLNLARVGLTLNPVMKMAYLVPRYKGGVGIQCVMEPSYQGLVKLTTDTGSVVKVYAHPVYKGDVFRVELGMEPNIIHEPKFETRVVTHAYAVGVLHDGSKMIEVMGRAELDEIAACSESHKAFLAGKIKSSIYVTWAGEMYKKAPLKRLCKALPKTDRWTKIADAIEIDNEGYDLSASYNQLNYIDSLIGNSAIGMEEEEALHLELKQGVTSERAGEIISTLKSKQLDPVTEAQNAGATEINRAVNDRIALDDAKEEIKQTD